MHMSFLLHMLYRAPKRKLSFLIVTGDYMEENDVIKAPQLFQSRDIREKVVLNEGDGSIVISTDVSPVISYALYVNKTHLVKEIRVKSTIDKDIYDLKLKITTDNDLIEPFIKDIPILNAGQELFIRRPDILAHASTMLAMNEMTECLLKVSAIYEDKEIAVHNDRIQVLACSELPEHYVGDMRILAAFVLPNNPAVEIIRKNATKYLERKDFNGDPSFSGYQHPDDPDLPKDYVPKRVQNMAAALYYAIRDREIAYSEPPASFTGEVVGTEVVRQKVRFPEQILIDGFGTCMDMTLFYAACLEMSGLNAVLIRVKGHIFAGVWLTDDLSVSRDFSQDLSLIEKKVADGINELLVIECTAMCKGPKSSFDEACISAKTKLTEVVNYVDISLARKDRILPIPIANNVNIDVNLIQQDIVEDNEVVAPTLDVSSIDIESVLKPQTEITKIEQWERKLLDFSMHNHLLNTRASSTLIPILVKDLSELENLMASEQEFELVQRPEDWARHDINSGSFETFNDLHDYADGIVISLKQNKLHSLFDSRTLSKVTTKLYRDSRSAIEENGVNSLYLAMGVLKWLDYTKTGKAALTPHYAPIILIPIDLIRRPANVGYSIVQRDEEAIVNRTLLEFLKQQFGMDITGLNPPPHDENGIDVLKTLTIIRRAIEERANWKVIDCVYISNFSFAQFMMWNDVHSHADSLRENKIVNSLVSGKLEWDTTIPDDIDNDEALLPVPVDASQLHAIKMAANGISFVLHGPPGTGKSQTITAMIANALYKGKTVLFVAEKQAALNVVYRRLKRIGLENFCLELHSNKAQKSKVLNQLKQSVDIRVWDMETDYESKIKQIKDMREKLDAYVNNFHKQHTCGMSIRELIDAYESLPDYDKKIKIDKKAVRNLTKDDLEKHGLLIGNLFAAGSSIRFEDNPLSDVKQTEYSQSLRRDIETFSDDYCDVLAKLKEEGCKLSKQLGWKEPSSFSEWTEIIALSKLVTGLSTDNMPIGNSKLQSFIDVETAKDSAVSAFDSFNTEFVSKYNESIFAVNLDSVKADYADAQKKLFGKQKAMDSVINSLQQHLKMPADISMIESIKSDITRFNQLKAEKEAREAAAINIWNGNHDSIASCALDFLSAYKDVTEKEEELNKLLIVTIPDNDSDWIEGKKEYVENLCANSSELRDWIVYQSVRSECSACGIEQLCQLFEEGFNKEDILPLYYKTVYKELIWQIIDESPMLNSFSGSSFEFNIEQYKRAEEEYLQLTKEELYHKLTHNLPTSMGDPVVSRELTSLKKAISSSGRGVSLRNLFDSIPHILTRLCPCLLMSPMSVAQYLTTDFDKFDLVIFDEASQVPTAQAVGALARGIDAVIVGDPNQMPPTSFFSSDISDDENRQSEDLDSILDDCLALSMPDTHLLWHYRSKHESLIAFSNKNYYDGSMFTFPSVNDRERCVKMCTVNGTYNRHADPKTDNGKNFKEAEAIVKEVIRRFNSPLLHNQSVGIVTFNIKQRDLIKDLIDEECKKNIDFDKWAYPKKYVEKDSKINPDDLEDLFVKNLENVQGDERDVILFSIGFGPDENGKVYYNFGPLNQDGGWKRLNVAVSRSRREMVVFSSMTSDMIDINRSSNDGVNQLHDFLKYAETGILGDDISKENFHAKGITLQICKALEDAGYKTQKNVGSSDLKIDIAVINPYDQGEYLLGVMLDGDSYKKAENTKDRELSQQSVLEGLGWSTYRIWTMDWWDNKNKEIKRLLEHVEECRAKAEAKAANPDAKDSGPESEELTSREVTEEKKERKKKDTGTANSSFETRDRFTVITESDLPKE